MTLLAVLYWKDLLSARSWMPANWQQVYEKKEYWRAWTTLFVHADEKHLFSNGALFFIFASFLYGYFGFLLFPLAALLLGGVINLMVLYAMPAETMLIGMSGVVFWMGAVWLTLYMLIDRSRRLFPRTLRGLGVALAIFFPAEAFDPSVSYKTHFIGFIFGILFALFYFHTNKVRFRAAEVTETVVDDTEPQPPSL